MALVSPRTWELDGRFLWFCNLRLQIWNAQMHYFPAQHEQTLKIKRRVVLISHRVLDKEQRRESLPGDYDEAVGYSRFEQQTF